MYTGYKERENVGRAVDTIDTKAVGEVTLHATLGTGTVDRLATRRLIAAKFDILLRYKEAAQSPQLGQARSYASS